MTDIRNPKAIRINSEKAWFQLQIILSALSDTMLIAIAWIVANKVDAIDFSLISKPHQTEFGLLWSIVLINVCIMMASGIYKTNFQQRNSLINLLKSICLAQVALLSLSFLLLPKLPMERSAFSLIWWLILIFLCSKRIILDLITGKINRKFALSRRKILLLGTKEDTVKAKQLINATTTYDIQQVVPLSRYQNRQEWIKILNRKSYTFDEIFFCSWSKMGNPVAVSWELKSAGINWRIVAVDLRLPNQWSEMSVLAGMPTVRFNSSTIVGVDFWCKRLFDLVVSGVLLTVFAVPMLFIAILIKLDSSGSIFYQQERVGVKGSIFKLWKFRTMVENAQDLQAELEAKNEVLGGILFKIREDPRITKLGRVLRRYSLDELPQLYNVLRGDMSLVGPRPLPLRDVAKLSSDYLLRHEVLPGITGLWQVNGRSDTNSEEIFRLDSSYIQNWSLILDLQILLKTIQVVIAGKGAY